MQLFFRKLAVSEGPVSIREALDVSSLVEGRADITAVSPLQTDLNAVSLGDGMMSVEGTLTVGLDMLCSRCLSPMHEDIHIEFHEKFKKVLSAKEAEDQDGDVIAVVGDSFDTVPYCEELFVLQVPFAPLCSEDCKGLSPKPGQSWSADSENSDHVEVIDPRLAGLKDFFK